MRRVSILFPVRESMTADIICEEMARACNKPVPEPLF